ncbi:MAG: DNA primase [Candidatus Tenebribacter burtonii]|jgi:DNA primase|nr:DNA primase [Candidatus Tenebribacter burtonii]
MDQHVIDEIIERNDIVDVISSYIPLKKTGSNFKARCPFHDEKTASFVVSPKKQIYKCFGCGKGGNVITFVQEFEKISFPEALRKLAARAGITVQQTIGSKSKDSKRDLIYKIYEIATGYFYKNLIEHGNNALEYLIERDIKDETIKKFKLGFALNSYGGLRNYLLKNDINEKILATTGLFTFKNNDLFRERIMFPIHSSSGKVVAFGGRKLYENQSGGKYVNSPTTDIYTKGNELYGLFDTKYTISKKDNALICEGYTDFLRLYESGFTNSVASLGTSLTDSQISILSRFTENIYMLYDGDSSGRKAAVRAAGKILGKGLNVKIIGLPKTDDPDSYIRNNGASSMQEMIDKAKPLAEFLKDDEVIGVDKKGKLSVLFDILNEIEDEIAQELLIQDIAETFGLSEHAVSSKIRKKRRSFKKETEGTEISEIEHFTEERAIILLIINNELLYKKVAQEIDLSYFLTEKYRKIYKIILEHIEDMGNIPALISKIDEEDTRNMLTELSMSDIPTQTIDDAIIALKTRKFHIDLKIINAEILNDPTNMDLFTKKNELKREILKINKKVVRRTLY